MLDEILHQNMIVIIFFYGLVFFLMGVSIFLKYIKDSSFKMAESLRLLAAFAIIHGLAEWGDVFIPIQAGYLKENTIFMMRVGQMLMDVFSFAMLFYFAVELGYKTFDLNNRRLPVALLPGGMVLLWWLLFVINRYQLGPWQQEHWLRHGDILARYLLGFPGALLSGVVLWFQRKELARLKNAKVLKNLTGAAVSLALYAVATGLVVPPEHFICAGLINTTRFYATFHFPIQILRAICGLGILYHIVGLLKIFDWERHKRLEEAERNQAVLQERERIARDLHDGIIQSIYAIGLNVENSIYLVQENTDQARAALGTVMDKLNGIVNEIRAYVLNLRPLQLQDLGLGQRLKDLVDEFKANSLIDVTMDFAGDQALAGLSPGQVDDLYHVVREALSNVLRHAAATAVQVRVAARGDRLYLQITDNGRGFKPPPVLCRRRGAGKEQGLCNMAERVAALQGHLEIKSRIGQGTEIKVDIPLLGGESDAGNH